MGLENLIRRVKDGEVKVTSADNIELVYNSVLPGLPLRHDPAPPATLPLRATAQYFRFDQAGAHWDYIKRNMGIGIHIPADFPELKYEVLIALP
jgi:predicted component of type VI protein secretion system